MNWYSYVVLNSKPPTVICNGLKSFPNWPLYKIVFVFVSPFFLTSNETDLTCGVTSSQIFASRYSTGPSIGPETTWELIVAVIKNKRERKTPNRIIAKEFATSYWENKFCK